MLSITSTISPSTAADLSANSWCSGLPAAAKWNIATTMTPPTLASTSAIGMLSAHRNAIAPTIEATGGSTFQMNMFSSVNTAFEVAVMRLVSVPESRSAK